MSGQDVLSEQVRQIALKNIAIKRLLGTYDTAGEVVTSTYGRSRRAGR